MPVNIKGKQYITVAERVQKAHELHKDLQIQTEISIDGSNIVRCKAVVFIGDKFFTGHAEELRDDRTSMVNKTSAVENCETSAVGRALGFAGIGILEGIATADEVIIAERKQAITPKADDRKAKIMQLIKELKFEPTNADEWKSTVLAMTQLTLEEKNYNEIIERLNIKLATQ